MNRIAEWDVDGLSVHCEGCTNKDRCEGCETEYENIMEEWHRELDRRHGQPWPGWAREMPTLEEILAVMRLK